MVLATVVSNSNDSLSRLIYARYREVILIVISRDRFDEPGWAKLYVELGLPGELPSLFLALAASYFKDMTELTGHERKYNALRMVTCR